MLSQPTTEEDPSLGITPPLSPRMPWRVAQAEVLPGYRVHVRFIDGTEGTVDMSALVHSPAAGVFAQLAHPDRFAQAFVLQGAVTWPGEIDLAPDAMYAEIKKSGRWVLG